MSDIHYIHLTSCTVFWEQINLKSHRKQTEQDKELYARWWDAKVVPWANKVMVGREKNMNPHEAGVWFADRRDAIRFIACFQNGIGDFQ